MSKAPYMPLFIDALIGDTLHLSAEEFGAYCLLLFATWKNDGQPLPDDDAALARVCRVSRQKWVFLRKKLTRHFDLSSGSWRQKRLEKEWENVQHRIDMQRKRSTIGGLASAARRNHRLDGEATTGAPQVHHLIIKKERRKKESHTPSTESVAAPEAELRSAGVCEDFCPESRPPDEPQPPVEPDLVALQAVWPNCRGKSLEPAAYHAARRKADAHTIQAGAEAYVERKRERYRTDEDLERFTKELAAWLREARWLDEVPARVGAAVDPDENWRVRMRLMRDSYERYEEFSIRALWPREDRWGPPPGSPGCEVPAHVLAEFPQVLAGKEYDPGGDARPRSLQ